MLTTRCAELSAPHPRFSTFERRLAASDTEQSREKIEAPPRIENRRGQTERSAGHKAPPYSRSSTLSRPFTSGAGLCSTALQLRRDDFKGLPSKLSLGGATLPASVSKRNSGGRRVNSPVFAGSVA